MVELWQINPDMISLNYANLKRLPIETLIDMRQEHYWREMIIRPNPEFVKLVEYVLSRRRVY